jgi:2-keto-4-pentenoate hydratase/2-oxohepta-3-ene-1,7-dioic acid hydratase in catechol pathway
MRLVTYKSPGGPRVAGARGGKYFDLNAADPNVPACVKALLGRGREGLAHAQAALQAAEVALKEPFNLLPPIPNPEKVICVGVNYADHAAESGMAPPGEPVIFNKFPTTIRKSGDPIVLPALSSEVDYEAELVVVIGRGGRHIPEEHALKHVAAYCCGNDVSARDWQKGKPGGQWLLGKTFDSFAPFGPELVTADEVPDPGSLWIRLRLNGQVMQDSSTSQLIFPVEKLVSYVSGVATLSPGDLIFTGTPPGVGMARKPPVWLKPGDAVEVEIEGLGVLSNPVVAES